MIFLSQLNAQLWEEACKLHETQLYGDKPYPTHLAAVHNVLLRFNLLTHDREQAVIFHDALEDQGDKITSKGLLTFGLSTNAVDIVERVTDSPGATRKERKLATYLKIAASEDAIIVKLADRIANVEQGLTTNNLKKLNMYAQEHADFKKACYSVKSSSAAPLWAHLDNLLLNRNNPSI